MSLTSDKPLISVLIPAHNEADYIADCLSALLASDPLPGQSLPAAGWGEVLVLANGCTDATADIARSQPVPDGWHVKVLDLPEGGKLNALTLGDAEARADVLVYLDADVTVSPKLLPQITRALTRQEPRYASGTPRTAPAQTAFSRAYGRFWVNMPFVRAGVPGFGLFAMNRAGRARWQDWPDIIADDTFARLTFSSAERIKLPATYSWPLVEGFRNLTRVRRRQNAGVAELAQRFPQLLANDDKQPMPLSELARLALRDPFGFAAYALVTAAVKTPLFRSAQRWTRGR
ncbi:N-glycosyltransferase [Phaeobacter sp. CECT 5382]|uniref:glycosyltransferase family 2 protein n=1 Tax=Phaeobacter sp. CECT 5382 TaxID=1712645 RepID=UPI0006D97E11|nr:glycosyltransferase family 2 protein [Phaeobacter sp. CECT 5382]CUH87515.1 N-glycosyltransferase [Phaeobacter sp. CECT 5382]